MSHGDFEEGQRDFRRLSQLKYLFVDNEKEIMELKDSLTLLHNTHMQAQKKASTLHARTLRQVLITTQANTCYKKSTCFCVVKEVRTGPLKST